MRKILFVIPSLSTGGTNSALGALYTFLKGKYNIKVFAISHQPKDHYYSFDKVILPHDSLLSLIYSNYSDQKGFNKVASLGVKLLRKIWSICGKDLGLMQGCRVAQRLEQSNAYDWIVGFQEGYATLFTSCFSNPNKVAWIHCNYNKYLPEGLSEESLYSIFKTIVCVSNYTASLFSERYPSLANRTMSIHNMIDEDLISNLASNPIDDDRFVTHGITLLSVGRFSPVKRFREIPYIASLVKGHGIDFSWFVLGPSDDGEEIKSFLANLSKYDVQDNVKWLGGKSNPYPYFKLSDIYICLSESEACPMVFKEAQLFALPIITTDFPSAKEFIQEGEGFVLPFECIPDAIIASIHDRGVGIHPNSYSNENSQIFETICALFGES